MDTLKIQNDGREITSTNYWQDNFSEWGVIYCSINAGAFRLLLPPALEKALPDMHANVAHAVVTRGLYQGRDALEIMFEDGSDSPFAIHLPRSQIDRMPVDEERPDLELIVYIKGADIERPKQALRLNARYQRRAELPHMKGWKS